eukprot:858693-Amorphochlora_amoeboformis.AAC.1
MALYLLIFMPPSECVLKHLLSDPCCRKILKANPSLLDDLPLSEYAQMRETLMGHDFDNKHALLQFFSAKNTVTQ